MQRPTVPPRQPQENNLIVITHGYQWNGTLADVAWVDTMANAIRTDLQRRGLNNWQVVPIKWTEAAWGIPETALGGARITGALYGAEFAQVQWQHIHLIGHSAGSVFIEAFAKEIKDIWPDTTIHSTFLDPYLSVVWGLGRETYGVNSDWADCYFAHDWTGIFTEGSLTHAHSVDVAWLDPQKRTIPRYCSSSTAGSTAPFASTACGEDVSSSHGWPVDFYLATILGTAPANTSGYGFPLSQEAGGTANSVTYPVGNTPVVLGGAPPLLQAALPQRSDGLFQIDQLSYAASDTGAELFGSGLKLTSSAGGAQLLRAAKSANASSASPAWLAMGVTVTGAVNYVTFEAGFTSASGAESLLTAYWDTNLLGTVDERVTRAGLLSYRLALPATVTNGLHVLGFRLDSFNGTASSVAVTNVATGFVGVIGPLGLEVAGVSTNGVPVLKLTGPSGFNYEVQFSTNLTSWTAFATLVNTNGSAFFADPAVTNAGQRFYRAVLP